MKHRIHISAGLLLAAALAAPAQAHHAMGGGLPSTFGQGLLSGLAHPVIGLDHLAFLVAAALIAGVAGLGAAAPLAFVAASLLGVVLHLMLVDLPAAELVIGLSVIAAGAGLAAAAAARSAGLWIALFAVSGLFHGYAYGESIVGAEPSPLAAYFLGLALVQSAIALATWRLVRVKAWSAEAMAPRLAGAAAFGVGLSALIGQVVG
jgi:urease accessory protein